MKHGLEDEVKPDIGLDFHDRPKVIGCISCGRRVWGYIHCDRTVMVVQNEFRPCRKTTQRESSANSEMAGGGSDVMNLYF
jgi:hypothetical protein